MIRQKIPYVYKAMSRHYKYSTIVYAFNVSEARKLGLRQAKLIYGNHEPILRDVVTEQVEQK